jgi:hypothetical protein
MQLEQLERLPLLKLLTLATRELKNSNSLVDHRHFLDNICSERAASNQLVLICPRNVLISASL